MTKSIFIDGSDHAHEMLKNLRMLGVRTSLDDFGTGYSSLSYLRRLPFDKIKIDKSFIDDVTVSEESLAIIRAIVALADALGMSTTAEGVESSPRSPGCAKPAAPKFRATCFHDLAQQPVAALFARRLEEAQENERVAAPPRKVRARAG